jgi:uncharacterized protein YecE (DUF72 family)
MGRLRSQAPTQPSLFASEYTLTTQEKAEREAMEQERTRLRPLAARLPANVRFGTSSWSFSGWKGIVYAHTRRTSELAYDGLREYAAHPLLRTVGIDRGYYAPIPREDLARYFDQTPDDFVFCTKAPESVVSPIVTAHRDKQRAGQRNEDFLSVARLADELLSPLVDELGHKAGPVLLEFPPLPPQARLRPLDFAEALDDFLAELPPEMPFAVELRDRALFTDAYRAVLARRNVAHVFNYWSFVPTPGQQRAIIGIDPQPFVVVRLLLRPGARYEAQREAFAPFDRVIEADPGMRLEVVELLRDAQSRGVPAYVLVNNKAEGCSPRTIEAIAALFADRQPAR